MKILAVICEYNPFHNGHEYQLRTERVRHGADGVVCLMSGSFVQRGAPAMFDKWSRAKAAILSGADLVLELPVVYSAQSAMRFAWGAVSLLNALGCIDLLSFGSECGDLAQLTCAASMISDKHFIERVSEVQRQGISYPAARSKVFETDCPNLDASLLQTPNNTLAIEYIRALRKLGSNIKPVTLKRNFAHLSASVIRDKVRRGEDISKDVPQTALGCFNEPYDRTAYDQMVSYHFRRETAECLSEIADVAEGLEHRFLKAAGDTFGAEELASSVKNKRYTRTRIDRIIVNSLLGITDRDTELSPQYARVLAFNDCGTKLLREIAAHTLVPVITKTADAKPDNPHFARMLEKDLLATDIYALLTKDKRSGQDFKNSPIYVKK